MKRREVQVNGANKVALKARDYVRAEIRSFRQSIAWTNILAGNSVINLNSLRNPVLHQLQHSGRKCFFNGCILTGQTRLAGLKKMIDSVDSLNWQF